MLCIMPNYTGKLPKFVVFDVAHVMFLEYQYSHIVPIIAKEGKIQFGVTEDQFCDPQYHPIYDLSKRGTSILSQLSKLMSFANFKSNR